ncbi:hypothetical protein Plo01_16230 [Planobispora longispora]|uniref:Uncharacterized protein n=1 Tax=Planobispora longispora TaxID=28887 RepID=A0A8J3RHX1_9ACTN|nr:hypothetical protein GCM10020093_077350 [Planobispora longispora]GIH75194.1 hypothetical protein Plo01_16230 [Planobispora longispora]
MTIRVPAMATSDNPRYPWDDLLRTVNDRAQKYFAEYRAIPAEQRADPDDGFGRATCVTGSTS